jgi:competence ComEA-like helix-hairpin-helix protein
MSTNTDEHIEKNDEKKAAGSGFRGWRKACAWLLGAAALALVGYRGTLGTSQADAATAPLLATAEPVRIGETTIVTPGATPPQVVASSAAGAGSAAAASTTNAGTRTEGVPGGGAPGGGSAPSSASAAASAAPDAAASASAKTPPAEAPSPAITADGKVILNLATEVELRKLPGIGKARAQAILDLRAKLGKFKRVEDLLRVKGIGVRRLAAIKPKVVLDAP